MNSSASRRGPVDCSPCSARSLPLQGRVLTWCSDLEYLLCTCNSSHGHSDRAGPDTVEDAAGRAKRFSVSVIRLMAAELAECRGHGGSSVHVSPGLRARWMRVSRPASWCAITLFWVYTLTARRCCRLGASAAVASWNAWQASPWPLPGAAACLRVWTLGVIGVRGLGLRSPGSVPDIARGWRPR